VRRNAPRNAPRPQSPDAIERAYARALLSINHRFVRETQRFLAQKAGRDADELSDFASLDFGLLQVRLGRLARGASRIVDTYARRIALFSRQDLARVLAIDIAQEPPAVRAALAAWRKTNVSLIRSIATRLHDDVRETVQDAVRKGTRIEVLASRLQERYSISRSRARLIAADQVLKANGDLTRIRHREAGIVQYRWSSSKDVRVRESHKALEGTIQAWDAPPVTNEDGERNHPGGDFRCRCVATPILL
jgi:SPP1 gp7 family putative phage head morphogenesis protein